MTDVEVTLRWRDLDHQGHVYHAAMVSLLDEARVAWLSTWVRPAPPDAFVVVRLDLTFAAELRITDRSVRVSHTLLRRGTTSLGLREEMRASHDDRVVVSAETVIVMWDADAHEPRMFSEAERRWTDDALTSRGEADRQP